MKKNIIIVFIVAFSTVLLVGIGGCFYFQTDIKNLNAKVEQLTSANKTLEALKEDVELSKKNVVVLGDTRTGHDAHQRIVNLVLERNPSAVFNTGDLVEDGTVKEQWDTFNQITAKLRKSTAFYPAIGNHEKESKNYYDNFELPGNEMWYSVDANKIHFIVLNSNKDLTAGSEQYKWLASNLKNADENNLFTVAVFHHPPFSTGQHEEDEMDLRQSIVPLFEKYGVDAVFNGHDHDYERSFANGIYYIVAGGGGAPLRDQARNAPYSQRYIKSYNYCMLRIINGNLEVNVYDDNNNIIDGFIIQGS